jgi:hypothetical protein
MLVHPTEEEVVEMAKRRDLRHVEWEALSQNRSSTLLNLQNQDARG